MTSHDNINLLCKEFGDSVSSTFRKFREDNDFTDVTLACEDREHIEAHKVILTSSSPLFRDMLKKINHSHPIIFLRGIKSRHVISILDFIYCGEVNILQEDITDFFDIAENLEVRLLQAETRDISKDLLRVKAKQEIKEDEKILDTNREALIDDKQINTIKHEMKSYQFDGSKWDNKISSFTEAINKKILDDEEYSSDEKESDIDDLEADGNDIETGDRNLTIITSNDNIWKKDETIKHCYENIRNDKEYPSCDEKGRLNIDGIEAETSEMVNNHRRFPTIESIENILKGNQTQVSRTNIVDDNVKVIDGRIHNFKNIMEKNIFKGSGSDNDSSTTVKMEQGTLGQDKYNKAQNISMDGSGYYNKAISDDLSSAICPQCGEDMNSAVKLKEHMTQRHFSRDIRERYVLSNSRNCSIDGCGKDFPNSSSLVRHIGSTHSKVLEIMKEKGFEIPSILSAKRRSIKYGF